MDPLSITASALTLIQAASSVSNALCKFVKTFRNADAKVSSLCSELSTLISFLEAVDRTLNECRERPLSLASMDEDLWRQSAVSLTDCKVTLGELESFINRIKTTARSSSIFRRARTAVDLTMYSRDISGFQEKINKSNWALQTMLSAINVSLSLRGNVAQDKIIYELGRLKLSIEQSLQVSHHHRDGLNHALGDPSDARVTYNLRNLAKVAQNFHSSASSTASTIYGANGTTSNLQADQEMSVHGLSTDKRQQIRQYLKQTRRASKNDLHSNDDGSPDFVVPSPRSALSVISSEIDDSAVSEMGDDDETEVDDDAEFELLFLNGLEVVAKDSMLTKDFAKAETILEKAIQRRTGSSSDDGDFKKLQIQLAICYFFQSKWRLAEPLLVQIAKSKTNLDGVICNLLHALALAHLIDYQFEKAIIVCKQALQGKRRLKRALGNTHESECNETLGLLATIYDIKGDPMYAEVLRRMIPSQFCYEHPSSEIEFIIKHQKLAVEVFGEEIIFDWRQAIEVRRSATIRAELPAKVTPVIDGKPFSTTSYNKMTAKPLPTFHTKLDLYAKFDADTAKEVVVESTTLQSPDAEIDDQAEIVPTIPFVGRELLPKRSFTRKMARLFGTVRLRPQVSLDELTEPTTPSPYAAAPLRRNLTKKLWPKSENTLFRLKKSKTKLRRKPSTQSYHPVDNVAIWSCAHELPADSLVGRASSVNIRRFSFEEPPHREHSQRSQLRSRRPKLAVDIPRRLGTTIEFVKHYPALNISSVTTDPKYHSPVSLDTTVESDIMARVLHDFTAEDAKEMSLKRNDFVKTIRKAGLGWMLVEKDGEQGWVPAAYLENTTSELCLVDESLSVDASNNGSTLTNNSPLTQISSLMDKDRSGNDNRTNEALSSVSLKSLPRVQLEDLPSSTFLSQEVILGTTRTQTQSSREAQHEDAPKTISRRFSWDLGSEDLTLQPCVTTPTETVKSCRASWCNDDEIVQLSSGSLTNASSISSRPTSPAISVASSSTSLCSSANTTSPEMRCNTSAEDLDSVSKTLTLFMGKLQRAVAENAPDEARIISTAQVGVTALTSSIAPTENSKVVEEEENLLAPSSFSATKDNIEPPIQRPKLDMPNCCSVTQNSKVDGELALYGHEAKFNPSRQTREYMAAIQTSDIEHKNDNSPQLETCSNKPSILFRPRPLKRNLSWWSPVSRQTRKLGKSLVSSR